MFKTSYSIPPRSRPVNALAARNMAERYNRTIIYQFKDLKNNLFAVLLINYQFPLITV